MRKPFVIVITLAVAAVATACYQPYDLIGDIRADRIYVDADGVWRDADGTVPPLFTNPELADRIVPGNYDGDFKWEAAATDGINWYTAGDAGTIHFPFPEPTLYPIAVPADYDGDRVTEPAWWSRATGTWYIQGQDPIVFGSAAPKTDCSHALDGEPPPECLPFLRQDIPVPADYDGDRVAELAVFNPVLGEWRFHETGETLKLGGTGDLPVVADWDGDGTQDPAVFDLLEGRWEVEGLGDLGVYGAPAGSETVFPVPANYTGDARVDRSVVVVGPNDEWRVEGGTTVPVDGEPGFAAAPMPTAVRENYVRLYFLRVCEHYHTCHYLFDTPFDFDGDDAADPAWMNAAGEWWWDGAASPLAVGNPGDVPVAGAYRRIGTIDLAAITAGGVWRLFNPTLDIGSAPPPPKNAKDRVWPVPADYDGDGLDESAWYRDSDATWWIDGKPPVQFGVGGTDQVHGAHDVPVPGDYDGDGRAEIVVYRPTDGTYRTHGGGVIGGSWPNGIPAPANYSPTDRGLEPGVYDPVTRTWWEHPTQPAGFSLGESVAGIPVPGPFRTGERDDPAIVVPNGATMEWRYIGECCEITVQSTPIGTPLMARAAVIGAIPRLTYLASLG